MNINKDSEFLFASEDTIFRIVSIAKIMSWVLLAFYLIIFANDVYTMIQQRTGIPSQFWQATLTIVELLYRPAIGLFYFLVLQGVAHGLNLGLDIYYDFRSEEDEEEVEEDEEV
jgi:hypothetical protein